ncbi:hypothetical protein [Pseudalkalibacillus salsuginis]|uniref:hypothetical protein n=1 Tax=Pseudalkalibacillus salsuginis TaxID=2910972 RepID=UPI001F2F5000|nr:hypothetical protein [Pseudalkalibacillus salsuginis]MCF6409585.1 hypothetical protein [Pseudalkalibacillus salsuginis]
MNFKLFSKMDQLENQLNNVSYVQQDIISNVNGQTGHIENVLNGIKEEQSWISRINMDVNTYEIEDGQAEATFEWQVKELQSDSEVVFHYAYGDREDFTTIPAEEGQQGLFQVKVPVEVDVGPQWEVVRNPSSHNEMSKKEMEEKMEEEHRQNTIEYYVTVSYGDMVKSGEIHTENLEHLGTNNYGILQTDVHMYDRKFDVTLMNHNVNASSFVVEEAYLFKYEDERLLGKEKIKIDEQYDPSDEMMRFFHLNQVDQYEDMRLVIKVVYSNGGTFEKEVY